MNQPGVLSWGRVQKLGPGPWGSRQLTFPQPGNSHAWTRLPFFALLMRPVGVHDGAASSEMDEVLMVEELSRRDEEPGMNASTGE
jgi:hypothetical protein